MILVLRLSIYDGLLTIEMVLFVFLLGGQLVALECGYVTAEFVFARWWLVETCIYSPTG